MIPNKETRDLINEVVRLSIEIGGSEGRYSVDLFFSSIQNEINLKIIDTHFKESSVEISASWATNQTFMEKMQRKTDCTLELKEMIYWLHIKNAKGE